ncbi:hypothetical protein H4R19_004881, partial [Coemansia spiralis]
TADRRRERYFSHAEPAVTVADLDRQQYRRDRWPPALDALLSARTADVDCLISAVVVRLADGYLVSLSVSHLIADAAAAAILLRQWAALAAAGAAAVPVDCDHPRFWARLTAHPADIHPYVAFTAEQDYGPLDEVRARIGTLYATGSLAGGCALAMRVLHVSGHSIARLAAQHSTAADGGRLLHGVQFMYALLWHRYVAAVLRARPTEMGPQDAVFLNLLHNMRGATGAEHYIGNAVGAAYVPATIDELLTLPVAALVRKIKPFVNSVTPGRDRPHFALKAALKAAAVESLLTISNASRLPFFAIDFGLGAPRAVLCGTRPTEGVALWLPNRSGGIDIHLGLKDDIYSALRADTALAKYVHFAN